MDAQMLLTVLNQTRAALARRPIVMALSALLLCGLTVVAQATAPAVLRTTPLGDLRIVSRADADSPTTPLATVLNAGNTALQQAQGQSLQWSLSQAQFVPGLTQVLDPSGQVLYQTNQAINGWVVRMSAPPQCDYNLVQGVVVFDDNWQTVVMASALETNSNGPTATGCPNTPVTSTDPTSITPHESTPPTSVGLPGLPVGVPGEEPPSPGSLLPSCGSPSSNPQYYIQCVTKK
jgi:hypothetical protein